MDPRDLLAPQREYHRVGRGFQVDTSRVKGGPARRTNATTRSLPASRMRSSSQRRSGNDSAQDVNHARTSSCPRCTEYSGSDSTGTHSISGCRIAIRESRLVWSSRSQNRRTTFTFSSDIAYSDSPAASRASSRVQKI